MTHWILFQAKKWSFYSFSFFFFQVLWSCWSVDIAGVWKAGDWRNYGVIGVEEGRPLERAMDKWDEESGRCDSTSWNSTLNTNCNRMQRKMML